MLRCKIVEGKIKEFYGDYDEDFVKLPRDNKEVWNGSYFLDTTSKQMYWYSEKTQDWST